MVKGTFLALGVICVLVMFGIGAYSMIIDYQYERDIGSYMSNSIDMVSPEPMLEQVQLARQAMLDSGLEESDYGAWIFKKPSNSMKFQYQHIDSIEERINAVIDWKNKAYGNESTSSESLGDVYEQKMTNLRRYIKGATGGDTYVSGDRSDWIAQDAWMLKNHFIMKIFSVWLILLAALLAVVFFVLGAIPSYEY